MQTDIKIDHKNMERLFAKIKKEFLGQDEKTKILSSLRNFVAENPVKNIESPFYNGRLAFRYRMIVAPISLVFVFVLVLAGSKVLVAAKGSLPGETLYSLKMLRENIESLAPASAKTRAEMEAFHAVSRLEEVEQIASENKPLEAGDAEKISKNFESQIEDAVVSIKKLEERGKEKEAEIIWTGIKESANKHEERVAKLTSGTSTEEKNKEEFRKVFENVRSKIKKVDNENNWEDNGQEKDKQDEKNKEDDKDDD